jgi:hypothetical protein
MEIKAQYIVLIHNRMHSLKINFLCCSYFYFNGRASQEVNKEGKIKGETENKENSSD